MLSKRVVAIHTLKRRKAHVRELPLPASLLATIEDVFDLSAAQSDPDRCALRLFAVSRVTAWRIVKRCTPPHASEGPPAAPKGMRHGFGVSRAFLWTSIRFSRFELKLRNLSLSGLDRMDNLLKVHI